MFEFLMFGIVFGVAEDLLAVKITTGEQITLEVILIVVALAIPFSIIGELIADNVDFTRIYMHFFGKPKKKLSRPRPRSRAG